MSASSVITEPLADAAAVAAHVIEFAEFITLLQEYEMQVVTFRDLDENPALTAIDRDGLFIANGKTSGGEKISIR